RALRCFPCPAQCLHFRMRPAARLGPPASENCAVLYDNRADRRIWPGPPEIATTERQREPHEALVGGRVKGRGRFLIHLRALAASRPSSSPDNSSRAARKSFASRKLR